METELAGLTRRAKRTTVGLKLILGGIVAVAAGLTVLLVGKIGFHIDQGPGRPRLSPLLPGASFHDVQTLELNELAGASSTPGRTFASPASKEGSQPVSVRVEEPSGVPIVSASVWCLGGEDVFLGTTNELGLVHGHIPTGTLSIAATARGYAVTEVGTPAQGQAGLLVVLQQAATIDGETVWSSSKRPAGGARVAAWPDGFPLSEAALARVLAGIPTADGSMVESDAQGGFRFAGLHPRQRYTLSAATPGGITLSDRGGVTVGSGPTILEVAPVFACIVHLRDSGGERLRSAPSVFGRGPGWCDETDQSTVVIGLPKACRLLIAPTLWAIGLTTNPDHLVLFSSPDESLDSVEATYEVEAAGYAPVWTRLEVPRISRVMREYQIRAEPTAKGWGRLRVNIDGPSLNLMVPVGPGELAGQILLEGSEGSQIGFAIRKPLSQTWEVGGVPFGEYRARFRSMDSARTWPLDGAAQSVTISDQVASIRFDASGSTALLIDPRLRNGEMYRGSAVFRLHGPMGTMYAAFGGPPFALEVLPPGPTTVYLDSVPGYEQVSGVSVGVSLTGGEVAIPMLQLPF